MNDIDYAKISMNMAEESFKKGSFPAGAVIVRDDKIISKQISGKYPNYHLHAESKAIDEAVKKLNDQLTDCTLYASMEPCLMCLSRAYWGGIRRIVYIIKKGDVDSRICYECNLDQKSILTQFNEKIEMIHLEELEPKALEVYKKWLSTQEI
jgi:tRNA(Arg) A34 adenosine deaminase TadA